MRPALYICSPILFFMRGKNTFTNTFIAGQRAETKVRKGRSSRLVGSRNKCLVDRYYYYGQYTDKRYESILDHLSAEFFLSACTVSGIVEDHTEQLADLRTLKPSKAHLARKWAFMKWP